jgi:hypothetical protein
MMLMLTEHIACMVFNSKNNNNSKIVFKEKKQSELSKLPYFCPLSQKLVFWGVVGVYSFVVFVKRLYNI